MSAEPNPATSAAAPATKRGPVLVVVAALVGALAGGGVGLFVVGPALGGRAAVSAAERPRAVARVERYDDDHDAEYAEYDDEEHDGGKRAKEGTLHLVDNLVLNPAGSGGTRFLLCSVALELASEETKTEFTGRDAEVRDIVLRLLGSKEVAELADIANRDRIRDELRAALAERFGRRTVRQVYFPQFVIQ